MQDILTTLATVTEIAALAYFSLGFACYVIQQSSPAPQCHQPIESVSIQSEVAEVALEEAVQSEMPQTIVEEVVQAPEIQPEIASSNIKLLGVRELRLMARERGIKGFARMNKDQLLAKLA
ncbi:MAG: Rho termination factor N-terminal domain-containing protein [Leptolyngbya sp. Prado105]|jgi:hypothetical protein|nr:Rho termination factor N-terminal domain-containing protein [Leptolyngbya sp. Prado105]